MSHNSQRINCLWLFNKNRYFVFGWINADELFIDYIDVEWSLRAKSKGIIYIYHQTQKWPIQLETRGVIFGADNIYSLPF